MDCYTLRGGSSTSTWGKAVGDDIPVHCQTLARRVKVVSIDVRFFAPKLIGCHSNVRWPTAKTNIRLIIFTYVSVNTESLVEIDFVDAEIFGDKCNFLVIFFTRVQGIEMNFVISGVTGPKFTKFLQHLA